jgi:hypothetical protein
VKASDLVADGTEYGLVVNEHRHDEGNQRYAKVKVIETGVYLAGMRQATGAVVEFLDEPENDVFPDGHKPRRGPPKRMPAAVPEREPRRTVDVKWIPCTWAEIVSETRERAEQRAYTQARRSVTEQKRIDRLQEAGRVANEWSAVYAQHISVPVESLAGCRVQLDGGESDGKIMEIVGVSRVDLGVPGGFGFRTVRTGLLHTTDDGVAEHHPMHGEDLRVLPEQIDERELTPAYNEAISETATSMEVMDGNS